ncbi:B47 [Murid betaherpesvirus 8]|uniref:B47 n=1 Tax=Rat cytomegalovirus (isolate England) TaxID=1261657 RepID=A0A0E3X492_RCMVE|nr:B47 [Murid betaherpesvirus 8]WPH24965.1 B47 [Murid betaherpesvirus 8]WPH25099.1 B47 [Murid betaherpesvirus 8]
MAFLKTNQHGIRALNLEQTLEDLRSKTASDEDLLNILAKIEISAVQLQTVTASRIRRFLQYVPQTGYHFEFIRNNSVFYFLNNGTFAPNEKGRFLLVNDLLTELRKHGEKHVKDTTTPSHLSNDRVLQTVSDFLDDLNNVPELQKVISGRCLIDDGNTVYQTRIREFDDSQIKNIESLITRAEPLRNCRAVAELLEEFYRNVFEIFRLSFTHKNFKTDDDTKLDNVMKLIHCYENHARTNDLETEFQKAIDRAASTLTATCITDIQDIQKSGYEYTKDVSFKISSKSLSAKERSDLRFPILNPSTDLLQYISPRNLLFYPGVVFALVRKTSKENAKIPELHAFNDFCSGISDMLFNQTQETRQHTVSVKNLLDRTKTFYSLGLTPKTTMTYVRMLSLMPTESQDARSELTEAVDNITLLVYNAHLHFLCLARYSNTFLFHHTKRLILEQQRSLLVGHRLFEDMWANVAFNVNRTFAVKYEEDEFIVNTIGLSPAGRDYLYRDATNKWDDIMFSLTQDDISDPLPLPPQRDPTTEEIAKACEMIDNDDAHSYNSLLPLSTYPEFDRILTEKTIIPRFRDLINSSPSDIRAYDDMRLLQLIHVCRLLMPRRIEMYRNLVSFYNLMHYVSHTDIGLVKVLYSVIRNVIQHICEITETSHSFTSDMLEDLAIEAFMNSLDTDIVHAMRKSKSDSEKIIEMYTKHCLVYSLLLNTQVSLFTYTNTIAMYGNDGVILQAPFPEFITRLQKLVSDNAEFEEGLQFISDTDDRIMERLKSMTNDIKRIPTFTDLSFNTRSMTRVSTKLLDAIHNNKVALKSLCADRFRFNRDACEIFNSLISAYYTLHKDRISSNGLQQCVADAAAISDSHTSTGESLQIEDFDQESIAILKKTFEVSNLSNTIPKRRDMTGDTQTSVQHNDFDYNLERYVHSPHVDELRDWYVEKVDKVQAHLAAPLRLLREPRP